MSLYTTRNTNATIGDHSNDNTAGRNEAGLLDKLVGKTEEKMGELKQDPKMQQEGAIRATDGKIAAEHFKHGISSGAIGATESTGGSLEHHTTTHGNTGYTNNTHSATDTANSTSHTTGVHDTTRATRTDKAVGRTKEKTGEWKSEPTTQAKGAVRATEEKPAATNFKVGSHSGSNTLSNTKSTGLSSGHASRDKGATHPTTGALNTTPNRTAKDLHDLSCPTVTDNVVGEREEKVGDLKRDPYTQAEGAIHANDVKPATNITNPVMTGSAGLSSGPHANTHGFIDSTANNNTEALLGTPHPTDSVSGSSSLSNLSPPTSGLHNVSHPIDGHKTSEGKNDLYGLKGGYEGLADPTRTYDTDINQTSSRSGLDLERPNNFNTQTQ